MRCAWLQVIRRLEQATEQELLPKDDRELVFATRLLQASLAVDESGAVAGRLHCCLFGRAASCAAQGRPGAGACRPRLLLVR